MVEAMVDAHTTDPELYELLLTEVPRRAGGTRDFAVRLHGAFQEHFRLSSTIGLDNTRRGSQDGS